MYQSIKDEQLICPENLFNADSMCDAYCFPVFKVGSETLINFQNVE